MNSVVNLCCGLCTLKELIKGIMPSKRVCPRASRAAVGSGAGMRIGMCRQKGRGMEGWSRGGCTHRAGVQRSLKEPFVQEAGTNPALWLGPRGLCVPVVGQAERAVLADQGAPQSCRVLPLGCQER